MVLFGRLLERLGGRVTLIATGQKAALLRGLGAVDEALNFDALPMHECFSDTPLDRCRLPGLWGAFDRLISCFAAGDRAAELRLAALCGVGASAFLPIRPPTGSKGHLLDLWADLLALDAPTDAAIPIWPVPQQWRTDGRDALAGVGVDAGRPYAVLHPGAGAADKCWPIGRFQELGRSLVEPLRAAAGRQVVFVLGPVEQERWDAGSVQALCDDYPVLARAALSTLAGVLAGGDVVVANDSGPAHLSAAVGAPTLALFGPTRPQHFAPVGPRAAVLAAETIDDLTVEEVAQAVARLLARNGRRRAPDRFGGRNHQREGDER